VKQAGNAGSPCVEFDRADAGLESVEGATVCRKRTRM
jgi:hypothetical protein